MSKIVNNKIFLDAVHGYIYVPPDYARKIIDTPNFQRLKRLEQTNIRPLYPCAHHDRFIHSLGTFHLGSIAFNAIRSNSMVDLETYHINWEEARLHFELACLLHDVGHSPFSHSCEKYYEVDGSLDDYLVDDTKIVVDLVNEFELFKKDYSDLYPKPKEHEKTSAILVLTEYYSVLKNDFRLDPFKIARAILGCKYSDISSKDHMFYNCLIELLNGDTIDVDKLDYIARDQWASGYVSKVIDSERLLNSIYIKPNSDGEFVTCFHKRAIGELYSLVEVKSAIRLRLHSHHIVKYDMHVLQEALEETAENFYKTTLLTDEDREIGIGKVIHEIISIKALRETVDVNGYKIKYPIDDDLIFILKANIENSEFAKEWFNRDYKLKAVWKTFADYKYYFNDLIGKDKNGDDDTSKLQFFFRDKEKIVKKYLAQKGLKEIDYYICSDVETEYNPIFHDDINIYIKDRIIKFKDLKSRIEPLAVPKFYFLLYLPKEFVSSETRADFAQFVINEMGG